MKANQLTISASRPKKRLGRGIGSGYGKTAGRGTKGQNARTGGGVRVGFEGGQNPLAKRLPKKRGFKSMNRTAFQLIQVNQLASLKAGSYDLKALVEVKLIKRADRPVKLVGGAEVGQKLELKIQAATARARECIEQAGGKIEIVTVKPTRSKSQA
jgi:large subunit ribosomal protein L15